MCSNTLVLMREGDFVMEFSLFLNLTDRETGEPLLLPFRLANFIWEGKFHSRFVSTP